MPYYITVMDTVGEGRVAACRDGAGRPIVYPSVQQALADADEALEGEPGGVVEVLVTPERICDPVDGRVYWRRP